MSDDSNHDGEEPSYRPEVRHYLNTAQQRGFDFTTPFSGIRVPFPPTIEQNGLAIIESFYGLKLEDDLVERVEGSPVEHLFELVERLTILCWENAEFSPNVVMLDTGEELIWNTPKTGALVEPAVSLDARTPLRSRRNLALMLLVAPQIVVIDPTVAWADSVVVDVESDSMTWDGFRATNGFTDSDGDPRSALIAILHGLRPLAPMIRAGDILLCVNPSSIVEIGVELEFDRLMRELMEHQGASLRTAEVMWRSGCRDADHIKNVARTLDEVDALGSQIKALNRLTKGGALRRASRLDALGRASGANLVPSELEPLYALTGRSSPALPSINVPSIELRLADAVSIRASEPVFDLTRSALAALLTEVGPSRPDEDADHFSARIRAAAGKYLDPVEEEMKSIIGKGRLFGLVPDAVSGAVRVGMGLAQAHIPGIPAVAKAGAKRAVAKRLTDARAASDTLSLLPNIQLTGRL